MRHVHDEDLDQLDDLLVELRSVSGLREKKRGVFYLGSRAFLHFHADPAGLFCDVRLEGPDFDRFRVSTRRERRSVLARVRRALR